MKFLSLGELTAWGVKVERGNCFVADRCMMSEMTNECIPNIAAKECVGVNEIVRWLFLLIYQEHLTNMTLILININ